MSRKKQSTFGVSRAVRSTPVAAAPVATNALGWAIPAKPVVASLGRVPAPVTASTPAAQIAAAIVSQPTESFTAQKAAAIPIPVTKLAPPAYLSSSESSGANPVLAAIKAAAIVAPKPVVIPQSQYDSPAPNAGIAQAFKEAAKLVEPTAASPAAKAAGIIATGGYTGGTASIPSGGTETPITGSSGSSGPSGSSGSSGSSGGGYSDQPYVDETPANDPGIWAPPNTDISEALPPPPMPVVSVTPTLVQTKAATMTANPGIFARLWAWLFGSSTTAALPPAKIGKEYGPQQNEVASLVNRARMGDQNAMAILDLVRQNVKTNPKARRTFDAAMVYIKANPAGGAKIGAEGSAVAASYAVRRNAVARRGSSLRAFSKRVSLELD